MAALVIVAGLYSYVGVTFVSSEMSSFRLDESTALLLIIVIPVSLTLATSRRPMTLKNQGLRSLAIIFFGILFLSWIMPIEEQFLLPKLMVFRVGGISVVLVIEFFFLLGILKLLFSQNMSPEEVSQKSGAPLPIAKLMTLEARFWKWLWEHIFRDK